MELDRIRHTVSVWMLQRSSLRLVARNFVATSAWMAGFSLKSLGLPLQLRHSARGQTPCSLLTPVRVMIS